MSPNRVHPTAVIEGEVEMGSGNVVMPYAVILGPVRIGDDNWIGSHAMVGAPPQHPAGGRPSWDEPQGPFPVEIGSGNMIRHFSTVTHGMTRPTRIGDGCTLMGGSSAAHDADYEDGVTLAAGASAGGYVVLGRNTNLGLGVSVHQRVVVGGHVMVGINAAVTADVPPFALAYGVPARVRGANRVGLERAGFDDSEITVIDAHYQASPEVPLDEAALSQGARSLLAAHERRIAERDRLGRR